ncbi:hypothetical protein KC220_21170, partial [Mycobacterium tuberculosis]|nr:hypothetical protein [Mycobacterium tuberculosis]
DGCDALFGPKGKEQGEIRGVINAVDLFTRCYATKLETGTLGDIGKLVPCLNVVMIFLGVCII